MASWNVFKFCTALNALGAVMVAVVLGVVGFTYYAVVLVGYGPLLPSGGLDSFLAVVILLLFHSLLAMLLWSYSATVLTDPGGVPPNWMPVVDEERGEGDALVGSADADSGLLSDQNPAAGEAVNHRRRRFCRQCSVFKPQRCHHCSVCGRCILKMDHHCVWVVNCIGALNYKYFLLFLFYTFLVTALVTVSLMPLLVTFLTADGDNDDDDGDAGAPGGLVAMFIACVLNFSFSLSVFGFLAMHVSLVRANTTTIEIYEKKKGTQWQYDLGRRKNFEQVFGMNKRYWLLPAYSEEDKKFMPVLQGLEYPTRSNSDELRQL